MKICFVGPANSIHIVKMCDWFGARGHEVHVISFSRAEIKSATVHLIEVGVDAKGNELQKLKYLTAGKKIKRLINEIQPNIVNAHYATSYGMAMALSGVDKYVLSVWGSDIFAFPRKGLFHKLLLKYSLAKATYLFSTSNAMAKEASRYTKKKFEITPFGVDTALFSPDKRTRAANDGHFVVGTVKTMSDFYGINYILDALAIIKTEFRNINVEARLAGDGSDLEKYYKNVIDLGIEDDVKFLGRITQEQAAEEWANMDVAIVPSAFYESFGVAAVEAQACGVPLIISDVEGLKEATCPGKSSVVVPKKSGRAIANEIVRLYSDRQLRIEMGNNGRSYVCEKYNINHTFEMIEELLKEIFQSYE